MIANVRFKGAKYVCLPYYVNERKPWLFNFLGKEIHVKGTEKDF